MVRDIENGTCGMQMEIYLNMELIETDILKAIGPNFLRRQKGIQFNAKFGHMNGKIAN